MTTFTSPRIAKARQARRNGDIVEAIGEFIGAGPVILAAIAVRAWLGMLLLGALAIETGWPTAVGFKTALILSALLGLAVGPLKNKSDESDESDD